MPSRIDRLPHITALESKTGKLMIYQARPSKNGQLGCYESHQNVMRAALREGRQNALIFEDDAEWVGKKSFPNIMKECSSFLSNNACDILFLGCFPEVWKHWHEHKNGHIFRVYATQTHAYFVNKDFMIRMCDRPYCGKPLDEVYLELALCYAYLPGVVVQANSPSSVSSKYSLSISPIKHGVVQIIQWYAAAFGIPLRLCVVGLVVLLLIALNKNGKRKTG